MVLLRLFRRFGDTWLVELLFDDLKLWTDWAYRRRTLTAPGHSESSRGGTGGAPGEALLGIGSDRLPGVAGACSTLHAVWESGLDNSPMYDGVNVTTAPVGEPCMLPLVTARSQSTHLAPP